MIRVPLILQPSLAVVHRLSVEATRNADPEGPETTGYDETLREPISYEQGHEVLDTRREMAPIRVPCQIETLSFEALRQLRLGDAPISNMVFVFHRRDLERLGLLDSNRDVVLKKGDRISAIERHGAPGVRSKSLKEPGLFVFEMRPRSWGFGPDGYDLELAIMSDRREAAT